ncbi:hypothetical protein [Nocardioides sp. AE5]|uniref:hypothetical protein n=1 Tax=Nocardioides sp. AE5 TaxID=2962573 RepID=UPI00288292DC|nr:hypothetical protein [Nocardioides sp. AE5]MDT0200447.1 hypothetical protein [Nocardioides sp. AE5]
MSDVPPPLPPNVPSGSGWGGQAPPPPPGWGQEPGAGGMPGPSRFEAPEAIGYGWKAFRADPAPLVVAALIVLLVPAAVQLFGNLVAGGNFFEFEADGNGVDFDLNPLALIFNILGSFIGMLLAAAMVRLVLDVVDGNEVSVGAMFSRFDMVQVVIAAVVLSIAITVGILLCFLPGLLVLFFTFFTNYFIVGKGQDAITAIKSSVSLVSDNFGAVLLLAVLAFLCMIGGIIACCIGILVAYPVVTLATAYGFRTLQGEPVKPV